MPRSIRSRIAVWISLLTGLALVGAGVAAYGVLVDRIEDRVVSRVQREIREFRQLQRDASGADFGSAYELMRFAQRRHLPGQNELILSYVEGRGYERSPGRNVEALATLTDLDPVLRTIQDSLPDGGWRYIDTRIGRALVAVTPVVQDGTSAAYAIVYFVDRERAVYLEAFLTYGVVALLAWLVVTGGAWLVARRVLRPVRALQSTAQSISETDLSRRIDVQGNDELTDLTVTFNEMLDRVEASVVGQREFLDDAGHELGTPVAIVQGHLHMLDSGDAASVERVRGLMADELDRITRLVDDMVLLAKAQHPDFLRQRLCHAGDLTDEVVAKSQGLGARGWEVEHRADALVFVDPQRITEALLQLTENAMRHTRDGDPIRVGSQVDGRELRWWVSDSGPGVQPSDRKRIFERFARGHGSSAQAGSGLGLSIVRAIAEAHGGGVQVETGASRGSTFVLTVPLDGDASAAGGG